MGSTVFSCPQLPGYVFPSDEAIIEAMSGIEPPWEELHHRSYFLPPLDRLEHEDYMEILS